MRSISINFDEDIFKKIQSIVSATDLSISDIVRDALGRWLKEEKSGSSKKSGLKN